MACCCVHDVMRGCWSRWKHAVIDDCSTQMSSVQTLLGDCAQATTSRYTVIQCPANKSYTIVNNCHLHVHCCVSLNRLIVPCVTRSILGVRLFVGRVSSFTSSDDEAKALTGRQFHVRVVVPVVCCASSRSKTPLVTSCGGVRLHQPVSRRVRMPPESCSARAKRHSGAITRRGSVASGRAVELTSCVALSSSKLT